MSLEDGIEKKDSELKQITVQIAEVFVQKADLVFYTQNFYLFEENKQDFIQEIVRYLNRPAEKIK